MKTLIGWYIKVILLLWLLWCFIYPKTIIVCPENVINFQFSMIIQYEYLRRHGITLRKCEYYYDGR
jgi:hypothetical protein